MTTPWWNAGDIFPALAWDEKSKASWNFDWQSTIIKPDEYVRLVGPDDAGCFFPFVLSSDQITFVYHLAEKGLIIPGRYETWGEFLEVHKDGAASA
jgi:hypothetical protein